jgi:adenine phosphoribosyltransferase
MLTPRQRLQTVLAGKLPDCVPVAPDFSNMIPARLTGKPFWQLYLYNDPPIWEAYIAAAKHFNIDSLMDGFAPLRFPEEDAALAGWERLIVKRTPDRLYVQMARDAGGGKRCWSDIHSCGAVWPMWLRLPGAPSTTAPGADGSSSRRAISVLAIRHSRISMPWWKRRARMARTDAPVQRLGCRARNRIHSRHHILPPRELIHMSKRLAAAIRDIPDFPKPGILFKDITPILGNPDLFREAVEIFVARHQGKGLGKVAAIDARGFIFGGAIAQRLGVGFVPIRKKGKLPFQTYDESYDLEYGSNTISVHVDAFRPGEKVLILDDLLATGGTAAAAARLVQRAGGTVAEIDFLIELSFLKGRDKLAGHPVFAAMAF